MFANLVQIALLMCFVVLSNAQSTTEDLPTTSLRDLTECELGRIRADSNPNKFAQRVQNENGTFVWILSDCQHSQLIFSEAECACVNPPQPDCPFEPVDQAIKQYRQILPPFTMFTCMGELIWNQTGCRCDWGPGGAGAAVVPEVLPCETIFSTTFDPSSVSEVQMMPWRRIATADRPGANGQALLSLPNVAAIVWKVSYTDFGPGFVIDFRFRSNNDLGTRDSFVALVANGCWSEETIAVNYKAIDRTYEVNLAAILLESRTRTNIQFTCQDTSGVADGFQWNTVSLSFRQGTVNLMVNDVLCRTEVMAGAVPDKPKCPLVIGHDIKPVNPTPGFFGWFDELSVRRFCPS